MSQLLRRDSSYELVIFDWDGTLMDSVPKILACVKGLSVEYGLDVPSDNVIRSIIGYSLEEALLRLFGEQVKVDIPRFVEGYRRHYVELDSTPSPIFEGVVSLLETLSAQGHQLAVATGKGREGLNRLMIESELGGYFAASRCADEALSKPNPLMLEQLLNELNVPVSRALMVGDTLMDLEMANNIGMDAVGVSYGAFTVEQLQSASPKAIIDRPLDLLRFM
ncbi:MAG: HAD-IA family hydrolase [Shewanella sp.]|nr:HAD-IA family hydrolase [Shewanella sp.]MCF1459535.1 HAD-IA family hydrolase [Shewanella sp.]